MRTQRLRAPVLRGAVTVTPIWLLPLPLVLAGLVAWQVKSTGDHLDLLVAAGAAAGQGWVLTDPAAVTVASTSTSTLWRAVHRLVVGLPIALAGWVLARMMVDAAARAGSSAGVGVELLPMPWIPPGASWLMFVAFVASVLATEAGVAHRGGAPGVGGIGFVLAGLVLVTRLPAPFQMLPLDDHLGRWALAAGAATLVLAWRLRDPGRALPRFQPRTGVVAEGARPR